jgi:hypothetical protein
VTFSLIEPGLYSQVALEETSNCTRKSVTENMTTLASELLSVLNAARADAIATTVTRRTTNTTKQHELYQQAI